MPAMNRGHWVTNRVANPVLRRLLRTPLGHRLGRSLAVLRYHGRRTGRTHELVVQYVRSGPTVWVLVARSGGTTWWHNLETPAEVDLWLAGERFRGHAVAVVGEQQPAEARRGLVAYLAGAPKAASSLGLGHTAGPDAVAEAARQSVLVRADLRSDPVEAA